MERVPTMKKVLCLILSLCTYFHIFYFGRANDLFQENILEEDEIQELEMGASSAKSELTVRKRRSRGKAHKKGHIAIALSIMAIAGGGLVNFPTVAIPEEAFYKVVDKAYPFLTLGSFFLALFSLLISSGMIPNAYKFALKLLWLALAMELLALIIAASLIAII